MMTRTERLVLILVVVTLLLAILLWCGRPKPTTTGPTPTPSPGTAYVPPIGIPAPPFGINEQPPVPLAPGASPSPGATTYTYVNSESDACGASGGATEAKPLCTLPPVLQAGAVLQVSGGPYTYPNGFTVTGSGTAAAPVFIVGKGAPQIQICAQERCPKELFHVNGSYVIVDGINFQKTKLQFAGSYMAIRNSEIGWYYGTEGQNDSALTGGPSNFVVYRNHIHHNGYTESSQGRDLHGTKYSSGNSYIWYLENDSHDNGADTIQIGDDCIGTHPPGGGCLATKELWPHHIYIGKNTCKDDRENCVDIKQAMDVVITENDASGYEPAAAASGSGSDGAAMVVHNGPERIWIAWNRISNSTIGVRVNGNIQPPGASIYVLRNVFTDIRWPAAMTRPPALNEYSIPGAAILSWTNTHNVLADNTVTESDYGAVLNGNNSAELYGNVWKTGRAGESLPMTVVKAPAHEHVKQDYDAFDPAAQAYWQSVNPPMLDLTGLKARGQCLHCVEGSEAPAHPAHEAYATFEQTYPGLSLSGGTAPTPGPPTPSPSPTGTPTATPVPTPTPTAVPTATPSGGPPMNCEIEDTEVKWEQLPGGKWRQEVVPGIVTCTTR